MAARPVTPARLLERDLELTQLDDALTLAHQGQRRVVLIEGPAGIGKTSLLKAACDGAAESGFTALRARATELEHDFCLRLCAPAPTRTFRRRGSRRATMQACGKRAKTRSSRQ